MLPTADLSKGPVLTQRLWIAVAILVSASLYQSSACAEESFYGSSTTGLEMRATWPWWQSRFFREDGFPKYGKGFSNSTRHHQYRVPINPPICGPTFGYFQPCWHQVPVIRRCVTCETLPPNREIPGFSGTYGSSTTSAIPPAPEASKDQDAGTEEGHSDPDTPQAAPIP